MKKLATLIVLAVLTMCIAAPAGATDVGQYVLTVKSPMYDIGNGFNLKAKGTLFMMTDYSQKWAYLGLNKGDFTLFGGFVSDWSDEARGFAALKFAPVFNDRWTGLTDFHVIDNGGDIDIFNWATIEYNTTLDGKPVYIGPQLESVRTCGETNHWVGLHVGSPDLVELGFYYHDETNYSARLMFVVLLQ